MDAVLTFFRSRVPAAFKPLADGITPHLRGILGNVSGELDLLKCSKIGVYVFFHVMVFKDFQHSLHFGMAEYAGSVSGIEALFQTAGFIRGNRDTPTGDSA